MENHTTHRAIFEKNEWDQKPILIMDGEYVLSLVNLFFVPGAGTENYLPHAVA